ncbi:MAG: response regulator, partial [Deltaproteobacteria bacterium]
LPDSMGLDTFTRIHSRSPHLPVIVFTGLHDEDMAIRAVQEGAQDYLVKGEVENALLARAIRYAIERRKLEERLIQSGKMEAIGQMAAGVAHDFNNYLMLIKGYARLLQEEIKEGSPLSSHVEKILSSSEKAEGLTKGLLALGKKQMMSPKTVDINDIVKRFEKFLRMLIGKDIKLYLKLLDKDLKVIVDSIQIEQVLMNLAINAKDAMSDKGELTVITDYIDTADEAINNHTSCKPGRYAVISISDTGQGIDEGLLDRIFDPFFTTKEEGKGTGLGLSAAYGIIKQHNGCIHCRSKIGEGTTFEIRLPIVPEAEKGISKEALPLEEHKKTLLLADDDDDIRTLFKDFFEDQGYRIIEAVDGEDAIKKFTESKNMPDLLVLDVVMPKKSGKEVYYEIKKIRPDIKALFISGLGTDAINEIGLLAEGASFISKPYLPSDLLAKVRGVLGG